MAGYPAKEHYDAEDLVAIVALLRDPEHGCPWDSVQTHASIRKNFLEETYEALEAIDAGDPEMLREELGDVLMQIVLHSAMESEKGTFSFSDVCDEVCRKLIYRHPHIFAPDENPGIRDWDALKNEEKGRVGLADELKTVPVTFPALMKAEKQQKRAAGYGAVPADADCALAAMQRAQEKLGRALAQPAAAAPGTPEGASPANEAAGEFLFEAVNWLRCGGVDAEEALELYTKAFRRAHTDRI